MGGKYSGGDYNGEIMKLYVLVKFWQCKEIGNSSNFFTTHAQVVVLIFVLSSNYSLTITSCSLF